MTGAPLTATTTRSAGNCSISKTIKNNLARVVRQVQDAARIGNRPGKVVDASLERIHQTTLNRIEYLFFIKPALDTKVDDIPCNRETHRRFQTLLCPLQFRSIFGKQIQSELIESVFRFSIGILLPNKFAKPAMNGLGHDRRRLLQVHP